MSNADAATRTYPWYKVEIAKSARSKCKDTKEKIPKGALKIGKMSPNWADKDNEDAPDLASWYLPAPFFNMLKRGRVHNDIEMIDFKDLDAVEAPLVAELAALHAAHKAWLALPVSERPKPKRAVAKPKIKFVPAPSKKKKVMLPTADETEALVVLMAAFFTAKGHAAKANPIKLRVLLGTHAGKERTLLEKIAADQNGGDGPVEDAATRASAWWLSQGGGGARKRKRASDATKAPPREMVAPAALPSFAPGAEPLFVFAPGATGKTAKDMHLVLNMLTLAGGEPASAVHRMDDNERGKVTPSWNTYKATGDRNAESACSAAPGAPCVLRRRRQFRALCLARSASRAASTSLSPAPSRAAPPVRRSRAPPARLQRAATHRLLVSSLLPAPSSHPPSLPRPRAPPPPTSQR